jgi:hypothetical protein
VPVLTKEKEVDSLNQVTYSRSEVDLLLKKQADQLTWKRDSVFKTALIALIMSIVGVVAVYIKG